MKKSILETSNRIYGIIIGLLGFSLGCQSCGQQADMYGSPTVEYGTPMATYIFSGKVTNADKAPIEGIEITVKDAKNPVNQLTDKSGSYKLEYTDYPKANVEITYKDIDGAKNGGEFEEYTEKIGLKDADFTGGSGSWYEGEVKKSINIVMEEKTEK